MKVTFMILKAVNLPAFSCVKHPDSEWLHVSEQHLILFRFMYVITLIVFSQSKYFLRSFFTDYSKPFAAKALLQHCLHADYLLIALLLAWATGFFEEKCVWGGSEFCRWGRSVFHIDSGGFQICTGVQFPHRVAPDVLGFERCFAAWLCPASPPLPVF